MNDQEQRKFEFQDRAREIWSDFGPLILGALVLVIILGGGYYLWKSKQPTEQPAVTVERDSEREIVEKLPVSEINLSTGEATPVPTPTVLPTVTPTPSPTTTPVVVAKGGVETKDKVTKGGQKLPATGLSVLPIVFSLSLLGGGLTLRKLSK